jgi:3',5'-cyclic AMP phosphodiesterase CpdA
VAVVPLTVRPQILAILVAAALASAGGGCRDRSGSPVAPGAPSADGPIVRSVPLDEVGPETLTLPGKRTSVKFAAIGDSGRGTPEQFAVAAQMTRYRDAFPYAFVIMLGDNIYEGPATPDDYRRKFEEPYRALLDGGVRFYAALGNHDDPRQVFYEPFNMHGERYYSFAPPEDLPTRIATRVEFFVLDSTNLDRGQLEWLGHRLAESKAEWKIVYMHHPLYTSGRYRTTAKILRYMLEPILLKHHVNAFFSGHEHIYQRTELENGVQYFVSGGAGSLRTGDGTPASYIARTFDRDYHFMLVEIEDDALHFQAISRTGRTIDAGTLYRHGEPTTKTSQDRPADSPPKTDTTGRG